MEQAAKLKRTWNVARPPNCSKDSWKSLPLFISINWPRLVTQWVVVQKIYSKIYPVSCTNTHHDVIDLVNNGMFKNTITWISWKWNITFLRNKKILNLCLRWHIFRSYCFVAEVTFNAKQTLWLFKVFQDNSSFFLWVIIKLYFHVTVLDTYTSVRNIYLPKSEIDILIPIQPYLICH